MSRKPKVAEPFYMTLPVDLNILGEAMAEHMSRGEVEDFICALDLSIADAEFTESLVLKLLKSLSGDLEGSEWSDLVATIAEFKR